MTLEFRREKLFPDLFGELHALLKRHWNEVALREVTGPLDIDEDMYRLLEANGNLILITARERGAGPGASADSADPAAPRDTEAVAFADPAAPANPSAPAAPMPAAPAAVSFAAPGGGQKAETGGKTEAAGEAGAAGEQRAEKAGETGKAEAAGAAGDEAERYEGQSRGRGILAGYAAYVLTPNLHYRSRLVAEADVFYLAPEYRRGLAGLRLLQAAERECIRAGAHIIQNKVKIAHDCGRLFERMGYRAAEKLYVKAVTEPHAPEED